MLKDLGYSEFVTKRPNLAVKHILQRITYGSLSRRVNKIYRLNEEDYKKDFSHFMHDVAAEAAMMDKNEIQERRNDTNRRNEDIIRRTRTPNKPPARTVDKEDGKNSEKNRPNGDEENK